MVGETVSFFVDGLIEYLIQLAYDCLFAVFYPVYALLKMLIGWLAFIWDTFYGFIFGFVDLANGFIGFMYNTFFSWMPSPVLAVLVLGVLIVVALRVYFFAKDISIAGFKI